MASRLALGIHHLYRRRCLPLPLVSPYGISYVFLAFIFNHSSVLLWASLGARLTLLLSLGPSGVITTASFVVGRAPPPYPPDTWRPCYCGVFVPLWSAVRGGGTRPLEAWRGAVRPLDSRGLVGLG